MSEQTETIEQTFSYRVLRGALRKPRGKDNVRPFVNRTDFINQGELVPDGLFSPEDIASWLSEGRIEAFSPDEAQSTEQRERNRTRGPWTVDPSSLVGKDMEALLLMILAIQEDFDTDSIANETEAVRVLTADWDPRYADRVSPASDRSRPQALALHRLEQTETEQATHMTAVSAKVMADAHSKAQAPATEE